jgi:hypothetical protein
VTTVWKHLNSSDFLWWTCFTQGVDRGALGPLPINSFEVEADHVTCVVASRVEARQFPSPKAQSPSESSPNYTHPFPSRAQPRHRCLNHNRARQNLEHDKELIHGHRQSITHCSDLREPNSDGRFLSYLTILDCADSASALTLLRTLAKITCAALGRCQIDVPMLTEMGVGIR